MAVAQSGRQGEDGLLQASLRSRFHRLYLTLPILQGGSSDAGSQEDKLEDQWHSDVPIPDEELKMVRLNFVPTQRSPFSFC